MHRSIKITKVLIIFTTWFIANQAIAQLSKGDLKNMDGSWEGQVFTYTRDMTKGNPMKLKDKPGHIRIVIRHNPSELWYKDKTGKWKQSSRKGFFSGFQYERQAGTIVGRFLRTGHDKDGQWVEQQLLYFTRKDSDTIILYWFRGVNNVNVPLSKRHSKFAFFRSGELKKVK